MNAVAGLLAAEILAVSWGATLGLSAAALLCLLLFPILLPRRSLRIALWLLTHSIYRLRRDGVANVPATGPALFVCNSVSWFDWLLLWTALPRRARIVVCAGWAGRQPLRWLLRASGALIVDATSTARDVVRVHREARRLLERGESVVLFAESRVTAQGLDLPFQRTFQRVARHGRVPIVPVCLEQPYGSLFCHYGERFWWKLPPSWLYPVDVCFGAPLPATTSAFVVRQSIHRLSAELGFRLAANGRRPAHRQFIRTAARNPFCSCLIDTSVPGGRRLSYARALAASSEMARLLKPMLGPAQNVAIWLPPSVGGALTNIAIAFLGKTSVNLNYTSSSVVVQSALRQARVTHVLTSHRFTGRVKLDAPPDVTTLYLEDLVPKASKLRGVLSMISVLCLPGWLLERWYIRGKGHEPNDVATLVFSSGSTGEPKGVVLTHANVAANASSIVQAVCAAPRDRILGVLPFFHSFGYTVTLWTPLQVGAAGVYHPDPRQAKEIGELCRRYRCTIYLSTATFLRFCLKKCDPADFKSLHILVCGAEKLPVALSRAFEERFGVPALEGYGCTELSPAAVFSLPDVVVDGFRQVFHRMGSIGLVMPGCVGQIVHTETRAPLPPGSEGLLLISGANVMAGYLDRQDLTAKAIQNGFYATGDVGRMDDDGFVWLTGRLYRFAKCGGEMVPLERVEDELHEVLETSERVCGVTCVPDETRGERLLVLYVAPILAQFNLEVRAWCQRLGGRGLPNLWVPAERDFLPVTEIPVLGSGKVDLKRLKDLALEMVVSRP